MKDIVVNDDFEAVINNPDINLAVRRVTAASIETRHGFNKQDYEESRMEDLFPKTRKGVTAACLEAYKSMPLVKNTIDLMTDLVVQGVDVVARTNEKFYKKWFHDIINGPDRCERITSLIYRAGTVVIKKNYSKLQLPRQPIITTKYTLLNPLAVDVVRDAKQDIISDSSRQYVLTIPEQLNDSFANDWQSFDSRTGPEGIAPFLTQNPLSKNLQIKLNNKDISVLSYKMDDWEIWGQPLCYCILDDLHLVKKMRLADLAALDGAVSKVRLWKLGSLEHKVNPTAAMYQKLVNILRRMVPGSAGDIVWNAAIDFKESQSDSHYFLGENKYIPAIKNILFGLGLPNVLHGFGGVNGASNNVVEMRIMVHRLRYVRRLLIHFFAQEFELIRQAMGFRDSATLVFDVNMLEDEASIYQALLGAIDRNVISHELFQERVGAVPEVEKLRIRRQTKEENKGKRPPKAGPFHDPTLEQKLRHNMIMKLFESGELDDSMVMELTGNEGNLPKPDKDTQPGGAAGPGRPPGSKDKERRKPRVLKAEKIVNSEDYTKRFMWAKNLLNQLQNALLQVNPKYSQEQIRLASFAVLTKYPVFQPFSFELFKTSAVNLEIPTEYQLLLQDVTEVDDNVLAAAFALVDLA